jgi:hypothetical protein
MTDALVSLLVRKKMLTQDEADKLEADAREAYRTGVAGIAEKNPDIAQKIRD